MITLKQLRIIDPDTTRALSDSELEDLRSALYASALLAFDAYWYDSNSGSKNPVGLLSSSQSADTI